MQKNTTFSLSLLLIVAMLFTTTCFAVKSAEAVGLVVPTYVKVDETSLELRNISTRVLPEYNEPTLHEDRTGYAPAGIQYAQHYTDHYMLAQIARERYVRAMGPATETWGYTPPLPDPQRVVAENR